MKTSSFKRVSADELETTIAAGVQRASASRDLTAAEIGAVSGGAASATSSLAYYDKRWFGIWPDVWKFSSKPLDSVAQLDTQIEPELGARMQAGMGGLIRR